MPDFDAEAILGVVEPLTFVPATVQVDVDTVTVGFVGKEFTGVDVSFAVPECAFAVGFVVLPITFVDCS